MEHLSKTSDLRQRRQKLVTSDAQAETNAADDGCDASDDNSCKSSSLSVSATRSSWFYWLILLFGVVVMMLCAWFYASYAKQLHETNLWFSNIQASRSP